jgi:hypothetical protein
LDVESGKVYDVTRKRSPICDSGFDHNSSNLNSILARRFFSSIETTLFSQSILRMIIILQKLFRKPHRVTNEKQEMGHGSKLLCFYTRDFGCLPKVLISQVANMSAARRRPYM